MRDPRPKGFAVPDWQAPPVPPETLVIRGRYVTLEPLRAADHAALLFREIEGEDWLWDYMPEGPFNSAAQFHRFVQGAEASRELLVEILDSGDALTKKTAESFVKNLNLLRTRTESVDLTFALARQKYFDISDLG